MATRIAHAITVLCLPILVMSGLQIFNAHPALYWGDRSDRDQSLLAMTTAATPTGELKGRADVFGHSFATSAQRPGFPAWATLPSDQWLAMGRRWHFFFAWMFVLNGLAFGLYALVSRHLSRDLVPWRRDLQSIGGSVRQHLTFRHPAGEAARQYNVLQKMSYTAVVYGLGPLIVATGLALSPRIDAIAPTLVACFGGRQSARTIHFVATFAFVGFTFIHIVMVAVTGPWNNLRSIVSGWYRIAPAADPHDPRPSS